MAKKCQLTGKCGKSGHRVSHSQIKTKRRFKANLQKKRMLNPATGLTMTLILSTKAIKTLKKWREEGKMFDLRKLIQK